MFRTSVASSSSLARRPSVLQIHAAHSHLLDFLEPLLIFRGERATEMLPPWFERFDAPVDTILDQIAGVAGNLGATSNRPRPCP
jgi:hypothetical protein